MTGTVIVTGAAGFIGSHLAEALSDLGLNVVASDHMGVDERWQNLAAARINEFVEPEDLPKALSSGRWNDVQAVFHQGANSDTTARDAASVMATNFHSSVALAEAAQQLRVPFVYASSASVYGNSFEPGGLGRTESPLNLYGYSKLLFDRYARANLMGHDAAPVTGLRYFNVYGEREAHKGRMASVVHHFRDQARADGEVRLFAGSGGYGDGEQLRDFVDVADVVKANLYFGLERPMTTIADVGTGTPRSFNDLAKVITSHVPAAIRYIPFPSDLEGRYQHWTCADPSGLRAAGFLDHHEFNEIEVAVPRILHWLDGGARDVAP